MLESIIDIVRRAGELVRSANDVTAATHEKNGPADLVTEYDLAVQRFLRQELLTLLPEADFFGEEGQHDALTSPWTFIVDPIDGTTNFVRGFAYTNISVALAKDGQAEYAVVYAPLAGELYAARRGGGATLNGRAIHVSGRDPGHSLVVCGSTIYDRSYTERHFAIMRYLYDRGLDYRRFGAAALDLCQVAAGRAEVFFECRLSPWDFAAGSLLVQEAGGCVTTLEGTTIDPLRPGSVFAATARYDGVELGTVRSAHSVSAAVDQLEEITRQTLSDTDYSIDSAKLEVRTGIVARKELESTDALEENLTQQLGLVDYAYVLYVEGEPVAATTFPGAIEQLLEQLKKGYITDSTVDCYFVENVEVKQEYVDQSLIMNLGYIAEKLNATKAGEVTYTVKSGDVWSLIAEDNGMTNEELLALNPGYDISVLHTGDVLTISRAVPYLTVVNVERQSYLQDVAYSVEYVDDPDMYEGDYEVLSKGVYGKADITANVTVINGTETAREVVSSVTLKEPVAERQARGTKERPTWFPTGSFRWPCYGVITSYFGGRNTGISGASSYHEAIDIANSYGTPIYAADGGTVIYSGWNGGLGYCVKIDHGNGFITWYGHNSDLYVSVGDHVYKGQTIAAMGSTGISSGSHCDFRIQRNGTMVDPLNYLP